MIKTNKQLYGMGKTSIRAGYLLSQKLLPIPNKENRKNTYFSDKQNLALKSFEKGYNLEGLEQTINYQQLFSKEGIHYVNGLIKRFQKKTENLFEQGMLEIIIMQIGLHPKKRAYKEALTFKKNYQNTKPKSL